MSPKTYQGRRPVTAPAPRASKALLTVLGFVFAFALGIAWPDAPNPDALACSDGIATAADPVAAAAACMTP